MKILVKHTHLQPQVHLLGKKPEESESNPEVEKTDPEEEAKSPLYR